VLSRERLGHGFTLVELLIAVTLVAMLIALAAPSMSAYLQNSKVASATQNLYAALQMARAEAIRRNLPVEFVLTDSSVAASDAANGAAPAASGQNWLVRAPRPASGASASAGFDLIDAKAALEGNGSPGAAAVQVLASASPPAALTGLWAFNGFGRMGDGSTTFIFDLSNPRAGSCAVAGNPSVGIRCRRIQVSPGGQILACDPAAAASDNRHCPP
jgi:type IV fimbrial biogenesis protein FimT